MEVEEDPSSQFVDFTNATALEQFVSDVEQTLIAWQLASKGHASPEALSAAFPHSSNNKTQQHTQHHQHNASRDEPLTWTRVLELDANGNGGAASCYALTLFASNSHSQQQHKQQVPSLPSDTSGDGSNPQPPSSSNKKWQEGLEHFTPTMLSIADTTRDFQWHNWRRRQQPNTNTVNNSNSKNNNASGGGFQDASGFADSGGYNNSSMTQEEEQLCNKRAAFQSVQKWFGVDEFLFLSRTSQSATRKPASTMNRSRPAVVMSPPTSPTSTGGHDSSDDLEQKLHMKATPLQQPPVQNEPTGDDDSKDFMLDIAVEQNEAGLLLSALTIALNNCNCTLPAFVPTYEPSRGTWLGSAVPGATGNVSIAFETDSIPEVSSNQSCISGLLDFFKLKLQLPYHIEEKYRAIGGAVGDADPNEVPIGMLVSASFGYTWARTEDPRELEADRRSFDDEHTLKLKGPQHQKVLRDLFGSKSTHVVGSTTSSLVGMDLTVIWPNLREGTYVDNVVHSSLDAKKAPEWMLEARFQKLKADNERKPQLALSKVVANLVQAYSNSRELSKDILVSELAPNLPYAPSSSSGGGGSSAPSSTSGDAAPLSSSRLHETIPAARAAVVIGNAIGTLTSSLVSAATWKGTDIEEIRRIVIELFEDDDFANGKSAVARENDSLPSPSHSSVAHSSPIGELVSILACRMGQLHGMSAMSLLWVEFVKRLRERWFQLQLLPAMSTAVEDGGVGQQSPSTTRSLDTLFLLDVDSLQLPPPDFHQCLLHQKLQLLNCCILRQAEITRSSPPNLVETSQLVPKESRLSDLTCFTLDYEEEEEEETGDSPASDDEFFDSIEQQEANHNTATTTSSTAIPTTAEGALRPIPGLFCLKTNAIMMEPVTQVAVPMTEDIAKQQQDLLSRLGASVESAVLRQQMQSAALVSDMQAFKAANPGCCLADFIRWYSPKDWIPFDPLLGDEVTLPQEGKNVWWFEKQGMLSDRMRFGSGSTTANQQQHLWQQMWESAAPIPVARQKCLFDPLHESEKIYHYLETISPHELFHQMLAGVIASAFYTLETALPFPSKELPVFHAAMQGLHERCTRAISLLDDALAESQVAFPAGRDQREEHERAKGQLQVAFEMALDACWKLVLELEHVEALLSNALALLVYFLPDSKRDDHETTCASIELVNLLLLQADMASGSTSSAIQSYRGERSISELLKTESLRQRVTTLVLLNPVLSGPVQREYVLRCVSPRPFLREHYYMDDSAGVSGIGRIGGDDEEVDGRSGHSNSNDRELEESPLVVNRMYAAFRKNTVRFALVLAESEF
ncbi:Rab3 gtpase-activating protein catalytic subunit [Globisporangium polare]